MKRLVALSLAAVLAACSTPSGTATDGHAKALIDNPPGPVVATVNGEALPEPMLLAFARGRQLDPAVPAQRQKALDELVDNVLLAQDAARAGLLDDPELRAELALTRLQFIAARAIAHKRDSLKVDDAQVEALYRQETQRAGDTEWKMEHVLFATREEAQSALDALRAPGVDFGSEYTRFPNAKQAKAFDWANATQLPTELVEALKQLKDGEVAPVVVQSSFGFHVLRRVASRPFAPPPLDSVREGARRQILSNGLKDYLAGLREAADIATGASAPADPH